MYAYDKETIPKTCVAKFLTTSNLSFFHQIQVPLKQSLAKQVDLKREENYNQKKLNEVK